MWISAGAFILIALIVCIGISIYVGNSMTHPEKKPIDQFPSDYGMDYEDIEFVSRDGETNLSGWVIEPETDAKMTLIFASVSGSITHPDKLVSDRKSTRLNSSHVATSYAVFCLQKK